MFVCLIRPSFASTSAKCNYVTVIDLQTLDLKKFRLSAGLNICGEGGKNGRERERERGGREKKKSFAVVGVAILLVLDEDI